MNEKEAGDLADQHISVASECHAIYRIVPPDENEGTSKSVGRSIFHVPAFPALESMSPSEKIYEKRDELDADLMELLLCLDWKVNFLIKMVAPVQDETIYPHRAVIKEMSVGRIKIETCQILPVGTVLEFFFVLPILPFKELSLKGDVTHAGADNERYEVALHTQLLKETDREHIIRYVVRRQFQIKRENLRK